MTDTPRVSIVTASLNQGEFIENTILSVLEQDYPNIEYILLDGGSTDQSVSIIERYAAHFAYWHSQPDDGQSAAINAGFERATGELFLFLNSDDFLLPGAVRAVVEAYRSDPDHVAWVGGAHEIAQDGYVLKTVHPSTLEKPKLAMWLYNWFYQPACFIAAAAYREVGGLDNRFYNALDLDLWMRLLDIGTFAQVDALLAAATMHPRAKTQVQHVNMYRETAQVLREHGFNEEAEKVLSIIDNVRHESRFTVAQTLYAMHKCKPSDGSLYIPFPSSYSVWRVSDES